MVESCVVARVRNYSVVSSEVVDGKVTEVIKRVAVELIKEWNPEGSDFMILRDNRVIQIKLPLPSPELYDRLRNYNIRRVGDLAEATIPVYEVIYSSDWGDEGFRVSEVILVFPFISNELNSQIINDIINTLRIEESEEEE